MQSSSLELLRCSLSSAKIIIVLQTGKFFEKEILFQTSCSLFKEQQSLQ